VCRIGGAVGLGSFLCVGVGVCAQVSTRFTSGERVWSKVGTGGWERRIKRDCFCCAGARVTARDKSSVPAGREQDEGRRGRKGWAFRDASRDRWGLLEVFFARDCPTSLRGKGAPGAAPFPFA